MHYHTMWTPLLPWQVFRRVDKPSIATFHDTTSDDSSGAILRAIFKPLSRYLLNRLDGAITVSTAPLAHLRPGRNGVIPQIIPPVTDLSSFLAIEKVQSGRPTVLFIGRLEPRKGITVLLEAWRHVVTASQGTRPPQLIIAGSGECEGEVTEALNSLGRDAIVHVPAPDDEMLHTLLNKATIAVSPATHGESFGIVLTEALAAGTPIIGAANAGYRHVLTGEGAELLVEPGNAVALAAKIMELLASPARCKALGDWGRAHARQFDVASCVAQFETAYAAAIARHNKA
jgi:phosphatidyl-myo-inositol alpha-mannosyltransferase